MVVLNCKLSYIEACEYLFTLEVEQMKRWLLKTEPGEYSWQDLASEQTAEWDGVKGAEAQKNMRSMKAGDEIFIYHTGKEKAIVGTARVIKEAYPDPENPRLVLIDLEAGQALKKPVTLASIKAEADLADWALARQPRLSVVPVSQKQWDMIMSGRLNRQVNR
jgi:predicted RNA-binding protein with PUA-like domain